VKTGKKLRIISNLVEKENVFISEKILFPGDSANRGLSLKEVDPLPGQKGFRLAQKGGSSSFPEAGFRRFGPAIPWPPRLFAETKRGEL
jgi:hypothetical protein